MLQKTSTELCATSSDDAIISLLKFHDYFNNNRETLESTFGYYCLELFDDCSKLLKQNCQESTDLKILSNIRDKNIHNEIECVINDCVNGDGFDDECLETLKYVQSKLTNNISYLPKSYLINDYLSDEFIAIVVASNAEILNDLDRITQDLIKLKIKGNILFDLFIKNSSLNRRYFSIDFDGSKITFDKFKKVIPNNIIKKECARFIFKNLNSLNLSQLSSSFQYALSRGIVI